MNKNLAFVFPGQGSQKQGMLQDIIKQQQTAQQLFKEASEILTYDLLDLVLNGPEEKLNQTVYTQPAMLVADIVMWHVWLEAGGDIPTVLAGHSLGEYSALVASKVIDFTVAVGLVAKRAAYMQVAVKPNIGAMAAILSLSLEEVNKICLIAAMDQIVSPANLNTPEQIVKS